MRCGWIPEPAIEIRFTFPPLLLMRIIGQRTGWSTNLRTGMFANAVSPILPSKVPNSPYNSGIGSMGRGTCICWYLLIREEIGRAHVELQSPDHLVCRLLLEKKNKNTRLHKITLQSWRNHSYL